MHRVGAAWLMTSMTSSPLLVGLVSAAVLLPAFLVGLWGGVLADLADRRRILIITQSAMMLIALTQGFMTLSGHMSPTLLLTLTFCLGFASALNLPAWQSQIQDIVPQDQVSAAVSLNSMSFNSARSVAPALGGLIIASTGIATVFFVNAASFLGTVFVLLRWDRPTLPPSGTAAFRAMREGIRYVFRAREMRAPLMRVAVFTFAASAIWAILPLLARAQLKLGPSGYGSLLAAFGLGSLTIGSILPGLRRTVHPDRIMSASVIVLSSTLICLGMIRSYPLLLIILFAGGIAWVGALVPLNVIVQIAVPQEMRGRAMSFYIVLFQGSMGIGSIFNGWIAAQLGISQALIIAGCVGLFCLPLIYFFPLSHNTQPALQEEIT